MTDLENNLCMAYVQLLPQWKKQLKNLTFLPGGGQDDGIRGHGRHSDRTADTAIRMADIQHKIAFVEDCCRAVVPDNLVTPMLYCMGEGKPFDSLDVYDKPCSKNTFYKYRKLFLSELADRLAIR